MLGIRKRVRRSGSLLVAVLLAAIAPPSARAQNCKAPDNARVCACTGCLYVVLCGVSVSAVPTFNFSICTGDNPGFLVSSWKASFNGLNSTRCVYNPGCGLATIVGTCCGGARSTVMDFEGYVACTPAGQACGTTGTSAPLPP